MSQPAAPDNEKKKSVDVTGADLPLHCPLPSQALWNKHPRVYLPLEQVREARCPYCGTLYRLTGEVTPGH